MKKLLVGCHPDDEMIFAGALLLRERDWKVVCLTNGQGPRAAAFAGCMDELGIESEIHSLPDSTSGFPDLSQLVATLRSLEVETYEKVVTHGLSGEYGHRQHCEVALVMHGLRPDVECFSFAPRRRLAAGLLREKRGLLKRFYGDRKIAYLGDWIDCESTAIQGITAGDQLEIRHRSTVPNFAMRAWRQLRWR